MGGWQQFSALALLFATAVAAPSGNNAPAMLTVDQWRADLRYLADQMPQRHKKLYHTMTPEAFAQAVQQLNAEIPHLNDDQIALRLVALATMPEDSHTGSHGLPPFNCYPIRLRRYADGLYVESLPARYADAVGGRLVFIGRTKAESAYDDLRPIVPHDAGNPGLLEVLGPVLLTSGHVLHGLGIEPTSETATYVVEKNGRRIQLDLTPAVPFQTLFGHVPIAGWTDARASGPPPLWLLHPDRTFWWTYVSKDRLFYIQFNEVENAPNESVAEFFQDAFGHAAKLPVDKLVLDLRANDGGNNGLIKPIIVGLIRIPSIDRPGHLFVITSRNTYSAAQNLVNRLETYTDAIFVGQPTGEHVNSYGDAVPIVLPNSHIAVGMASLWWQDTSERDKRIETDPQIAADPTIADYIANRDAAMDAIIAYRPEASLEDSVLAGIRGAGVTGGLTAYKAYATNPIHRYILAGMERSMNALGYQLLGQQKLRDAIAVFTVNVEANPNSANAEDSLGEAYADSGNREKAIESYRRALRLDPSMQSSRDALTKLGGGPI